jgi:hypothetical protein
MEFPEDHTAEIARKYFRHVAEHRDLSLRAIEKGMSTLAIALSFKRQDTYAPVAIILGLYILKANDPDLYVKAKAGLAKWDEVRNPLGFGGGAKEEDRPTLKNMGEH